ncbi:MAG: hypothetical protein VYB54_16695 [Pseudomonadota bacterium]|nr:hypothetical protein [Pseudomonadota bacterium]
MKLFFDNNLPPRIAHAANILLAPEHSAVALRDRFEPSIKDVDWMAALGLEGGWVVISADIRILRNAAERQAFRDARLVGFFVEPGVAKLDRLMQASVLFRRFDEIRRQVDLISPPATFSIPFKGRLRQLPT